MIQAAGGGLRSPRSEPGVPPVPVDRKGAPPEFPSWADRRFWDVVPLRDAVLALGGVLVVVGGALAAYTVRSVLGPVLVSLIVAYLFNPWITALQQRRVPRSVSAGVLAALIVAAEVVIVFWLGPLLAKQTVAVTRELPRVVGQLSRQIERQYDVETAPFTQPLERFAPQPGEEKLDVASGLRLLQWAIGGNDELASAIMAGIGVASYVAVTSVLFPIYVFLIAWHLPGLTRAANYIPRRRRADALRVLGLMNEAVSGFFRGRFVVSLIMAVLFAIGWQLCGVPYALLLGIGTGLLNVVPWASAAGWPLAVGLAYADQAGGAPVDWLQVVVWPSVVYGFVQGLDGWVLTPWIQSHSVDLSAVTVLIVVFVGGAAAGVSGLVLAVPVAACVKIFFREVLLPRWREWAERY